MERMSGELLFFTFLLIVCAGEKLDATGPGAERWGLPHHEKASFAFIRVDDILVSPPRVHLTIGTRHM